MKKYILLIASLLLLAACASQNDKALKEKDAALGLCDEKVKQLIFKSGVEYQECRSDAGNKYFQDIHSPFIDLVYLENAYYIKLAKQVDKGQLSAEDAQLKAGEYRNYIYHEAERRSYAPASPPATPPQ